MESQVEAKESAVVPFVTKPAEWAPALELASECEVACEAGLRKFKIRAVSYGEYLKIGKDSPNPQPPKQAKGPRGSVLAPDPSDTSHQEAKAAAVLRRMVATVDLCWMKIPGSTLDAKTEWIETNFRRGGELIGLYYKILAQSGMNGGRKLESEAGINLISTPEEWASAGRAPISYVFERSGRAIVFKLRGITSKALREIERAANPGPPPKAKRSAPGARLTGLPDHEVPNPEDPEYLKRVEQCNLVKQVQILEAAIGFEFPGKTMDEKVKWLLDRPAGEVNELVSLAQQDVLGHRDLADFF